MTTFHPDGPASSEAARSTHSRRQFLTQAAAASALVASGALSPLAHAAEPASTKPTRPRIGCLSWNFHSLRAGENPEPAIDIIGGLGFEAIELIVCARDDIQNYWTDAKVDQLKKQLEKNKLEVSQFVLFQPVVEGLSSLDAAERRQSLDYFDIGCRLGKKFGAPLVNIVAPWARELGKGQGYIPRFYEISKPREGQKYHINIAATLDYDRVWEQWITTVKALLERVKAHGLKLSIEHHTHCLIEDANAFLRLCDAVRDPDLGYNLDAGWTLLQREYPPVAIYKVGKRLVNLHMRDIDGMMRSFVPAGEGVMDFQAIADALKAIGFHGCLSLEQDRHQGMDMKAVCARYLELMKKCLG
ncbi:MAG: sugar phosphate isomerase/epimerase [Verrucomicrobia bacterium]|nr:sugar phosphate isomerase/epimerase [Verrucomicrobiota bacterium]